MKPTEKQTVRVARMIAYLGEERVQKYIARFFPNADIQNLTKDQAQKIITGLDVWMPRRPISGVSMSLSWIQNQ